LDKTDFNVRAAVTLVLIAAISWQVIDSQSAIVDYEVVDTATEWADAASSSTNVEFTDGFLQLNDSQTTGDYQSVNYDIGANNLTGLVIQSRGSTDNNSANATVQYKNDSGTIQTTETLELSDGNRQVDLNDSYAQVSVKYDLARDAASDASMEIDYYKVEQEKDSSFTLTIMKYLVPLIVLGAIKFL